MKATIWKYCTVDLIMIIIVIIALHVYQRSQYEAKINHLTHELINTQTALKQANDRIKILEDNQTIIYYPDNYGWEEVTGNASQILFGK
ncbi:Uncharacterised protein [Streptococcus gallolyticus]|uniref:Uncharacterized protein n=1 Tax=Streptococcus gallolyticus TaxID=315405 RepID=A0AA94S9Y8_9STRE|nr:hypothetical protein [Streptococcus gallolyticus]AQP41497.1 hypothetical protein BTR42_02500 [Streptococcus gallolyticus subsp. gallolyticus DSM 16831]MCY7192554.1 hypothetical protein [Streptococcus gallolyticus subsp. gallolyticus]SQG78783.1 Uncharacterised protein [Streptococcus gallolyticus]